MPITAFARRLVPMLAAGGVGAAALVGPPAALDAQEADTVRVIHVTIDSLHPDEVGPNTPTLQRLRAAGTWYAQARSIMASETLPNHVAMATGTYAGFTGIPGNDGVADPSGPIEEADPDLGIAELREARSFFEAIDAECPDLHTAGVLSKQYVWRTFADDPHDAYFDEPTFDIPESGHAPEASTVPHVLDAISGAGLLMQLDGPPDYLFANLGDVDRAGHIDGVAGVTGVFTDPIPGARQAAIQAVDVYVESIVQALQSAGLWESTVLIISSDHSMDYSNPIDPASRVDVAAALDADPSTADRFLVSENGGAGFVFLTDPEAGDRDQVLADARAVIAELPGVAEVLHRLPNPLDPGTDLAAVHPAWNLHQTSRAGDLFVHAEEAHVIGSQTSNPLPGNHGHGVTRHITALVTGGWDGIVAQEITASDPDAVDVIDDTDALPEQAEQVDFAPTFGWLLGVPDPGTTIDGGEPQWRGRVLAEAFSRQPAPACVAAAQQPTTSAPADPDPTTATTSTTPPASIPELAATGGRGLSPIALAAAAAVGLAGIVIGRRRVDAGAR